MSDQTGDDVPRDPWGNPLGPEDRAPVDPQPDDFLPPFPSDPPGGSGPPPQWEEPVPPLPPAPQEPPFTPPTNPAWPGSQPTEPTQPTAASQVPPPLPPAQPGPGWGGPGVPTQQSYFPPGAPYQGYGQGSPWAPPKNDGMAIGALVCGIFSLVCGLIGLFSVVLGPVAITLGFVSRRRIQRSNGALRGDGLAIGAIVMGIVGLLISIFWLVLFISSPELRQNITDMFTTTTTTTTGG
jgi:hypothetical protein